MKYIVLIGDGMADRPIDELDGLTPLQKASTPNMDQLASMGEFGSVKTIPDALHPGSDVANLSLLGYDPAKYYSGRAPLEVASMGISIDDNDVAYRCNLVYLELNPDTNEAIMKDYSAGHISTEDARVLMDVLNRELKSEKIRFYPGKSYRHIMVWKNGHADAICIPPHDILGKEVKDYMPTGPGDEALKILMINSIAALKNHEINKQRIKEGKYPANSIWLWGQGKTPDIPLFEDKYGIRGALISAVDLTKGLGVCTGFDIINVPGATGYLDTNYKGKAEYGLEALKDHDFVYIHVEAPDEAGHNGNYRDKIKAIEDFDELVVGEIINGLKSRFEEYRILVTPDHPTPIEIRTHSKDPVPFVIYDSTSERENNDIKYDESILGHKDAVVFSEGYRLMDYFIKGKE